MIAPASNERIDMIARQAKGFLYCESSLGGAGVRSSIKNMISRVKKVSDIPCAIGSGIATPQQAQEMAAVSDGAIVGSAIVNLIAQNGRNCI